jgi:hypothetical protein
MDRRADRGLRPFAAPTAGDRRSRCLRRAAGNHQHPVQQADAAHGDSRRGNNWAQIHRDREWEDRVKPALDAFEAAIVEVIVELRREWRNDLAKQWNERVGPEFNSLVREMREELRKEITDALSHEKSAEVIDLPDWRRGRGNAAA